VLVVKPMAVRYLVRVVLVATSMLVVVTEQARVMLVNHRVVRHNGLPLRWAISPEARQRIRRITARAAPGMES
jgi:hypothetical protein